MSLTGHRQASIEVILLDSSEREKGRLDGVEGGEVSMSAGSRLRASGTLNLVDRGQEIDWAKDRVKIVYKLASGESWPLGVFLFASPKLSYSEGGSSLQVELISKLSLLDGDAFVAAYQTVPSNHPRSRPSPPDRRLPGQYRRRRPDAHVVDGLGRGNAEADRD